MSGGKIILSLLKGVIFIYFCSALIKKKKKTRPLQMMLKNRGENRQTSDYL